MLAFETPLSPFSFYVVRPLAIVALALVAVPLRAQDAPADHQHNVAPSASWLWTTDANVFAGYNSQQRRFLDYSAWESQNWFMAAGSRTAGPGELAVTAMLSLERFTIARQGSPELFQTGESYNRLPLVNYQHPHDLVMGLGATYTLPRERLTYVFGADLVGSPTLGPTAFMHRASARDNPQVPITHHFLDSTHITPGVVRGGVEFSGLTLESSMFRGAEPDENRLDIERPTLDSWALRAAYARGPWSAQVSGGHMHQPEWWEPYDASRITASLSFDGTVRERPAAFMVAWGGNREFNGFNGNSDGFLAEGDLRATRASTFYGRLEVANKEIFGQEFHAKGQAASHPHFFSLVTVGTIGYIRELTMVSRGRLGIGADVVLYGMPDALDPYWAGSRSFHMFLRWRPATVAPHHHH